MDVLTLACANLSLSKASGNPNRPGSQVPMRQTQPFSCDLTTLNDVDCVIDASTFFIDSGLPARSWFSPGDHLKVKLPSGGGQVAELSIVDGQDPSQQLLFRQSRAVPFRCRLLSDFTQHLTFSAKYSGTTWQVEIIRSLAPQENPSDPDLNQCAVFFFMNVINGTETQNTQPSGSGGGFQQV